MFAGLEAGGRNMIGVGIATATAGIIVGAVTLTGVGVVMTELVELLSGGSIVIMLALVAVICILLGTGLPTTASYVVVATLMAPVVVELAAESDLAVPLIAVHMFVFCFGLMADVSPPVGLAAYDAGAIAGADPMKVGWQGTWYEMRTALLPFIFIFIFNPGVLMIDIGGALHFVLVVGCAAIAMMAFCAACQGFFLTRNRLWETVALLLVCFTLFRPNFWMDRFVPARVDRPASEIGAIIDTTPGGSTLLLRIDSTDIMGDDVLKVARLKLGDTGDAAKRLNAAGLSVSSMSMAPVITAVRPGSEAARLKLRPGDKIGNVLVPNPRPEPFWFAIRELVLLVFVALLQRQRRSMLVAEAAHS